MIKPTCSKLYMIPYMPMLKQRGFLPWWVPRVHVRGGAIYSLKGWTWASAQRVMVPGPGIRVSTDGGTPKWMVNGGFMGLIKV